MRRRIEIEAKVGIFVTIGVVLLMLATLILGNAQNLLTPKNRYTVHLKTVDGLILGAKVVLGGLNVGSVEAMKLDPELKQVKVIIAVARESAQWIREDSTVELATQGLLGDKFISISSGSPERAILPEESDIPVKAVTNLSQFIDKGDQLMISLNSIAQNLEHLLKTFEAGNRSEMFFQGIATTAKNFSMASEKLNRSLDEMHFGEIIKKTDRILDKINSGTGTFGALLNDSSLYDDAKALVGGANRNRVMKNLIRQTIKDSEAGHEMEHELGHEMGQVPRKAGAKE